MIDSETSFNTAVICTLAILLTAAVVTDLKSHRIPNVLLAPALSLALLLNTMYGGTDGLLMATGGLILGLLMFLPLYAIGGMGAGDVKLLAVVGSFLGPWGAVVAGLATMMAGAVFGIIAFVWRRIRPALEIHAAQLTGAPSDGLRPPGTMSSVQPQSRHLQLAYAPAIAAGTFAALWYTGYLPGPF
jgi:prepilin peptidase CpaA